MKERDIILFMCLESKTLAISSSLSLTVVEAKFQLVIYTAFRIFIT